MPSNTSTTFSIVEDGSEGKQWDALWAEGDFLPWDKLCASPALVALMKEEKGKLFNTKGRALVGVCLVLP